MALSIFPAALTVWILILNVIYQIAREIVDKTDSHDGENHPSYHSVPDMKHATA